MKKLSVRERNKALERDNQALSSHLKMTRAALVCMLEQHGKQTFSLETLSHAMEAKVKTEQREENGPIAFSAERKEASVEEAKRVSAN